MAQRRTIGIIYQNNENWIGGTYYILNLVAALNTLDDNDQPRIVLFAATEKEFQQVQSTGYPHLEYRQLIYQSAQLNIEKRIINKFFSKLTGNDQYPQPSRLVTEGLDALFPSPLGLQTEKGVKKIYWIPDFQELYYPQFFSTSEIDNRRQNHRFISKSIDTVVFSSKNALNDFRKLFPNHSCHTSIMQFAVTHPVISQYDPNELKGQYGLKGDFYIAPNQFWVHKNQQVIIEAARILKERNCLNFQIAFTGKEIDYRYPEYPALLKKLVKYYNLEASVKFLGFINRMDQLQLIHCASGLLQPSLFEGWSTVIEDGKALNKYIFASNLPVHLEQLTNNVSFFDPKNAEQLAQLLATHPTPNNPSNSYEQNIRKYAQQFINIVCNQ